MEKEVCVPSSGSDGLVLVAASDSPEYLGGAELRALGDFEGVELHDHVNLLCHLRVLHQCPLACKKPSSPLSHATDVYDSFDSNHRIPSVPEKMSRA